MSEDVSEHDAPEHVPDPALRPEDAEAVEEAVERLREPSAERPEPSDADERDVPVDDPEDSDEPAGGA
ncbi:hypothetical protein [Kineococcus sp. SYSU DK004]|uniref:hypothetical protein n=1 Tax=Kineococcus sp. SYSU DK004 TaxID=3383125 RepID=UPI003D7C836C